MARFKNFSMWRKRLPHWRADGETYYMYSKFRRELNESERAKLFAEILRMDGNRACIEALAVVGDRFELLFLPLADVSGREVDIQKLVEGAMRRTAKAILKKTNERMSPFFDEPFDRIVRDDGERQAFVEGMLERIETMEDGASWESCTTVYLAAPPDEEPESGP